MMITTGRNSEEHLCDLNPFNLQFFVFLKKVVEVILMAEEIRATQVVSIET